MSDEIKPALSAEEWEAVLAGRWDDLPDAVWGDVGRSPPECRSGAAAIGLLGAVTWDDVDLLREAGERAASGDGIGWDDPASAVPFDDLADRLAALLPPRPEG